MVPSPDVQQICRQLGRETGRFDLFQRREVRLGGGVERSITGQPDRTIRVESRTKQCWRAITVELAGQLGQCIERVGLPT